VFEETNIRGIDRLDEDGVEVSTTDRIWSARILLDCSGHSTLVGRHLGTRRNFDNSHLQKVAYFEHFENVERLAGAETGHPTIIMCSEGWFWLIGLSDTKTSVGFVTRPQLVKQLDVAPDRLLQWAIRRCPVVRHRMRNASGPTTNRVLSDFSYTCRPHAGPGYLLVGDAGCFLDPIFSTGVTLAMMSGREAAKTAIDILKHNANPQRARQAYCRFVQGSTAVFWRLIRDYYRHGFRELFMEGRGPLQLHRAVISALAGQVFPRPVWELRWRLMLFHLLVRLQRYYPVVPRRPQFSLVDQPDAIPAAKPAVES
jgi:flavin-dependent dehydrogenase